MRYRRGGGEGIVLIRCAGTLNVSALHLLRRG